MSKTASAHRRWRRHPQRMPNPRRSAIHHGLRQVLKVTVRGSVLFDVAKAMKRTKWGHRLSEGERKLDPGLRTIIARGCCSA
jgi:hypothetical protein